MPVPSTKALKTFQVAAELQSFKAAGEALCVTASAVSHLVLALEQELGVTLFDRGTRSLSLTDAGVRYLAHINSMFSKLEFATKELQDGTCRSTIRLNAPSYFASELLLPRLSSFSQSCSSTDIRIETATASASFPAGADLSIVVGPGPWEPLRADVLFAQSFSVACSPDFLLENAIDRFDDLAGKTLLVHEGRRDAWNRWAAAMRIVPPKPGRVLRLDTMSAVVRAAEQGAGIALVPTQLSANRFSGGSLLQLFPAEMTTNENYVLLQRPQDRSRRELQEFASWIIGNCRNP